MQSTFGMIKPEAIERKLEKNILGRISNAGLEITSLKYALLNENDFELIYGKVIEPEWLHEARREHMTSSLVVLLRIQGDYAVRRVLDIRGYSNPKYALPGTIRGDLARDQDYDLLRKQKKIALNLFHAADSEEEAFRLIKEFDLQDFPIEKRSYLELLRCENGEHK